jgi:hypothetical protein
MGDCCPPYGHEITFRCSASIYDTIFASFLGNDSLEGFLGEIYYYLIICRTNTVNVSPTGRVQCQIMEVVISSQEVAHCIWTKRKKARTYLLD